MMHLICLLASTLPTQPLHEIEPTSTEPSAASYSIVEPVIEPVPLEPNTPVVAADEESPEMEYTDVEANYVWTNPDSSALPTQPLHEFEPTSTEPSAASYSIIEPVPLGPYTPVAADEEFPELEYTYIEANYVWTNPDSGSSNLDGWELTGSLELPLNLFLQGTYLDQSSSDDVTRYRFGAGWHIGFLKRFDAYGILSYAHTELDNSSNDFSEDGYAGELGVRMLVTKRIEVNGRFLWEDVEDTGSGGGLGARFYLTEGLSLGARYDIVDNDDNASAGLRFEF